jgi:hypothetical protein
MQRFSRVQAGTHGAARRGGAACGGGSAHAPTWSTAACTREAGRVADGGLAILHHYAGTVYPADVAYLGFRTSLSLFERHECAPKLLGQALRQRLTPRQRTKLLDVLPRASARSLRRALAASGRTGS